MECVILLLSNINFKTLHLQRQHRFYVNSLTDILMKSFVHSELRCIDHSQEFLNNFSSSKLLHHQTSRNCDSLLHGQFVGELFTAKCCD